MLRGFVMHVGRKRLSLDHGGFARHEDKNKVSNSSYYRFENVRFAPYELRCAVVAVRGLPPDAIAASLLWVGGQMGGFVGLHDGAHRASSSVADTDYYQAEHEEFDDFGYDPLPDKVGVSTGRTLKIGIEWSGRGGRSSASSATATAALSLPDETAPKSRRPPVPSVFDDDGAIVVPNIGKDNAHTDRAGAFRPSSLDGGCRDPRRGRSAGDRVAAAAAFEIPRRRVAVAPRPPRGASAETGRGAAAAAARIVRGAATVPRG